ncbi:TPA: M15 family metallopeptidase, partial [Listeria monocytogenes]|nr:M15 family peptidase [Listeria monocytogenes]EHV0617876.1 M15 family metallopeptidase [Listeria monocytogenes]HCQ1184126.1 M15 family metallopeptidase [Listeria monocytogenes]HCQ1373291.1 M15 family metallopeptidase [Listeria monocytogenes]
MTSYYYSRSLENVNKLADNTKAAARKLLDWAENSGIEVLIYETIRTKEQQSANVANGASQTMRSYHLVGQALDFVMAKGKTVDWGAYRSDKGKKFVAKAKSLGFEWGGDWSGFVDNPHLQFNYKGYGTDTFGKGASTSNSSKPSANTNTNSLGLVDYMNMNKLDSSFANRKKLATSYGIKNYSGTASQNTTLLAKLKAGKPHTPASNNTYYTENPKKIKTLVQCDLYDSVDFTEKHK